MTLVTQAAYFAYVDSVTAAVGFFFVESKMRFSILQILVVVHSTNILLFSVEKDSGHILTNLGVVHEAPPLLANLLQ